MVMLKKFSQKVLLSAPHMTGEEQKYIQSAIDENWVTPLGPNVTNFENEIVKYLGETNLHAVAVSSGTAAIHIALKLLGLKEKEEVFCSSATFIASVNPVLYEKAVPVFIDSEPDTWNICPHSLLKAIEAKKATGKIPRFLIAVDLFGMSVKYQEIIEICKTYNIQIIEDAAESLGSRYKGKSCGTFGKFGILSFNGNKIITTSGGGMLITHSKEDAQKAIFLITQARDNAPYYLHSEVGYNYRLSNICAGIGLGQLTQLEHRVSARRNVYKLYQETLQNSGLLFQQENSDFYSNHWLSTALIEQNTGKTPIELINFLSSHNVEARHIWKPMHTQPIFKSSEFFKVNSKAVSEDIFERGICLPSCSYMNKETQLQVCEIIKFALTEKL
jgi:pyridoxal phosphate-dependent aminotransferase EpsN